MIASLFGFLTEQRHHRSKIREYIGLGLCMTKMKRRGVRFLCFTSLVVQLQGHPATESHRSHQLPTVSHLLFAAPIEIVEVVSRPSAENATEAIVNNSAIASVAEREWRELRDEILPKLQKQGFPDNFLLQQYRDVGLNDAFFFYQRALFETGGWRSSGATMKNSGEVDGTADETRSRSSSVFSKNKSKEFDAWLLNKAEQALLEKNPEAGAGGGRGRRGGDLREGSTTQAQNLQEATSIHARKEKPTSFPAMHHLPDYHRLKAVILQLARSYLKKHAGFDLPEKDEDLSLFSWFSVQSPGGWHAGHTHSGEYVCGVYYVQTAEDAEDDGNPDDGEDLEAASTTGALRFEDPRGQSRPFGREVLFKPKSGQLVLFPSWLTHAALPSLSTSSTSSMHHDKRRIILAFNLGPKSGSPHPRHWYLDPTSNVRKVEKGTVAVRLAGDEPESPFEVDEEHDGGVEGMQNQQIVVEQVDLNIRKGKKQEKKKNATALAIDDWSKVVGRGVQQQEDQAQAPQMKDETEAYVAWNIRSGQDVSHLREPNYIAR